MNVSNKLTLNTEKISYSMDVADIMFPVRKSDRALSACVLLRVLMMTIDRSFLLLQEAEVSPSAGNLCLCDKQKQPARKATQIKLKCV